MHTYIRPVFLHRIPPSPPWDSISQSPLQSPCRPEKAWTRTHSGPFAAARAFCLPPPLPAFYPELVHRLKCLLTIDTVSSSALPIVTVTTQNKDCHSNILIQLKGSFQSDVMPFTVNGFFKFVPHQEEDYIQANMTVEAKLY